MKQRRKRIRRLLLLIVLLLAAYSILIEPRWVQVRQLEITLPRLPARTKPISMVQLTDFHYPVGLPDAYYRAVVRRTNALHPDLIVLTGDFIARSPGDAAPCAEALADLHAPLGVWAVLGNHDYWTDATTVSAALRAQGNRVLKNQAVPIRAGGSRLWLIGLDDPWFGTSNLPRALRGVPQDDAKIVLVHEPDYADTVARYPVDLQLSGHSHGGQVRVPFVTSRMLPKYGQRYPIGLRQVGGMQLYTSRGIGGVSIPLVHWPLRFRCRPEITHITLHGGRPR